MRLDKYLSNTLGISRSRIKECLKKKLVTVGGEVVTDGSYAVSDRDEIFFVGKKVTYQKFRYYMFHKPAGCVTARSDKEHKTVFDYLKDIGIKDCFAVGRLDKDTEGLLFITNDGEFDHALMSPKKHVEKTYYFEAKGQLSNEKIKRLENGVSIAKDEPLTKPAKVSDVKNSERSVRGVLTITEGRFHQVKRMLQAVGCEITYLKRIAIGKVQLDEKLPPGHYRELTDEEVKCLTERDI